jgi:NitT/TauT family transport system substrate-binding protein
VLGRCAHKLAVAGIALVALLAAGCQSNGAAQAPPRPLHYTNITVAAVPTADSVGLYVTYDLGLFKAAGLNVTIKAVPSGAIAAAGEISGSYDIAEGDTVTFVQAEATGQANLEIVAEGSLMQPGGQALYTLPQSAVTTIDDLKGQNIGVNETNGIGTLLISSLLYEHGISPLSVNFVTINGGFPAMGQALKDHEISVAWLPEPFGSIDSAALGLRELTDLDQGATANFPLSWYVSTVPWAHRNPATLAAFLGALRQGQQIADTNRVAAEEAMEKLPAPYDVSPAIAAIMSFEDYPVTTGPDIDQSRAQRVADAMYNFVMLSQQFSVSTMIRS